MDSLGTVTAPCDRPTEFSAAGEAHSKWDLPARTAHPRPHALKCDLTVWGGETSSASAPPSPGVGGWGWGVVQGEWCAAKTPPVCMFHTGRTGPSWDWQVTGGRQAEPLGPLLTQLCPTQSREVPACEYGAGVHTPLLPYQSSCAHRAWCLGPCPHPRSSLSGS